MTNELGRELTTAEHIAVATGQTTIMDIVHGVAIEMDAIRKDNAQIDRFNERTEGLFYVDAVDFDHGEALNMDIEWNAQIHCVMPSGVVLTRGDLWYEMHRPATQVATTSPNPWIPGVNASSNMFA